MSRVLPILFNADMVQAILDDRKTATRRICKDGNDFTVPDMSFYDSDKRTYAVHSYADREHMEKLSLAERSCPICPEDILYVRETYCPDYFDFVTQYGNKHGYKADYDVTVLSSDISKPRRWIPSIHMPKEAARIWLKVTDVKVERLQDITNEQILREGISKETVTRYMKQCPEDTAEWERAAYIIPFSELWNSTVKKKDIGVYDWGANPWVWVIEFERCKKPEEL